MNNTLLLILLFIIISVIIAQVLRIQNNLEKPLILGIILGLIGSLLYYNYNKYYKPNVNNQYYNLDIYNICKEANKKELDEKKSLQEKIIPNTINYTDDGLYDTFPNFETMKTGNMEVSDNNLHIFQDIKTSNNNYNIDNELINGNIVNSQSAYTDDIWKSQQINKTKGDDIYTSANLHFSRKPKEAFLFQSRWNADSLRPWIKQELDDSANKIWWEDNQDLDQYM
jgi:hypothetical protein